MRIKVLVVSSSFPLSSKEAMYSFIFKEALALSSRGVVVHAARGIRSILDGRRDLVAEGIQIHNFRRKIDASIVSIIAKGMTELPPRSLFDPRTLLVSLPYSWFISKLAKRYEVDLIHAHFACIEGFAAMLARNNVQKPLVLTLHGFDILTEPSVDYGIRLEKMYDAMVRRVLEKADIVFGASRFVCTEALNAGCNRKRLIYLPNGVDLKRFSPDIDGSPVKGRFAVNNRPVIFTLRGHFPQYGIEYLIRAAPHVLRDVPRAMFIIGGDGALRSYHEHLAEELGVGRHILFIGRIPPKEVPYYLAACDIVVVPSVIEAFGLVTVEAMACGKPVVGSNVGGIPEVIKDGVTGYLVEPRDPEDIAEKIVYLLENKDLAKKMGENGRKRTEKNFNMERRIDKILAIYSELKR